MNIAQLKQEISQKELKSLYVFTGKEQAILGIYINKIIELSGKNIIRAENVVSVFKTMQNKSISASQGSCYIIWDDLDYLKQEKVWDKLLTENAQGKNMVILAYQTIDKRSKFYKAHEQTITEFEEMSAPILAKHISKIIGLNLQLSESLATICGCSYGRTMLECNKLQLLCSAKNIPIEVAFKQAIATKLIYQTPETEIFSFIDMVCRCETKSIIKWQEMKAGKESPLAVLSLLYTNFRAMLLVKAAGNVDGICDLTGLTPWQVKLAKEKGNRYDAGELLTALKEIRSAEKGIKTGLIEQEIAVDVVLTQLLF